MRHAVRELGQTIVMVTHDPVAAATRTASSSSPMAASPTSWPTPPPTPCSTTCAASVAEPIPQHHRRSTRLDTVMFRLTFKNLRANKVRFALTTFGVLLAVSFVVAAFVLGDGLRRSFTDVSEEITAGVDLEVRNVADFGDRATLPARHRRRRRRGRRRRRRRPQHRGTPTTRSARSGRRRGHPH